MAQIVGMAVSNVKNRSRTSVWAEWQSGGGGRARQRGESSRHSHAASSSWWPMMDG